MLKSVCFTLRQLDQLEKNEMRLRRAIRVSLLNLRCFASSGMEEEACVRALVNASRQMTHLVPAS